MVCQESEGLGENTQALIDTDSEHYDFHIVVENLGHIGRLNPR
jgi:hypothetical protein